MTGRDFEVLIVGSGFAGLGIAIELQRAGIGPYAILEQADDVGGTWRENRYPGCACDVPSHLYSFSFEPRPHWTRAYSPQPEIWAYLRHCADKYGVRPHIRFNTEMVRAEFDEAGGRWRVRSRAGQWFSGRALVLAVGGLSRPAYPDIPGVGRFAGRAFHSQQWDHGYDLHGKRVAVIGTGASAIQFIPRIAPLVERLDIYQRTPPWIIPKSDRPIGPRARWLYARVPLLQRLARAGIYWRLESRVLPFTIRPALMKYGERLALQHLEAQVQDPELRRQLTPDYTMGCKRVLLSDDYYPTLARPNVHLITRGIREIRPHGIVDNDGVEREVDAIIYGTGFRATEPVGRDVVKGRAGRDIWDAWRDGPEAFLGTTVSGFPNLFLMTGPNTGLGHNSIVFMIEAQSRYVVSALRTLRTRGLKWFDVDPAVQAEYNQRLQARLQRAVWSAGGCKSWYLDARGKNVTLWPGFTWRYRLLTRRFRPEHYVLCPEAGPPAPAAEPA